MNLTANENIYGLRKGRTYEVVEQDGSFVTVRDKKGRIYGRGLEGKPTIGRDRFRASTPEDHA